MQAGATPPAARRAKPLRGGRRAAAGGGAPGAGSGPGSRAVFIGGGSRAPGSGRPRRAPRSPRGDLPDGALRDAVALREARLDPARRDPGSDLQDGALREPGAPAPLPAHLAEATPPDAVPEVVGVVPEVEVIRAAAARLVAAMEDEQSVRDLPTVREHPGDAVRRPQRGPDADPPVALARAAAEPSSSTSTRPLTAASGTPRRERARADPPRPDAGRRRALLAARRPDGGRCVVLDLRGREDPLRAFPVVPLSGWGGPRYAASPPRLHPSALGLRSSAAPRLSGPRSPPGLPGVRGLCLEEGASFRLVLLLDRRARPERDTETKDLSSRRPKPQIPRFTGTGSLPTQNEASPPRGRARAGSRSSPSDEDERVPGSLRCPAASPLSLRAGEWKGRSHVAWAREGFRRYSRSPSLKKGLVSSQISSM
jgi:hypothetical protein